MDNEDLQDKLGTLQAKNQKLEKKIGELNKRIITSESELDHSTMKLIEAESRLQVETKMLEETKNNLVKITVKMNKLEREKEEKRKEANDEKEEFQARIHSLKRQTEKDKQTRAELVAEIERFREESGFKEDKEGNQMIIIEKLVQKLFSLFEAAKMSDCDSILTRLKDLEIDKPNTDKEELWTWLEKELQNAGVWIDSQKSSSEPDQRLQESELTESEHATLREENSKNADETKLSEDANSSILEPEVEHIPQNNQLLDNGSIMAEPQKADEPEKPSLLGSIDIGTCFCTYGFTKAKSDDKESIDDTSSDVEMKKVPTTALIEPTGDTLRAFGYDAEHEYKSLALQGKHKEFYYFLRFKMALGKEKLLRDDTIEDIRGKRLPAKKVISMSIDHITKDMVQLGKEHSGKDISKKDFHWTLSVPALWSDAAKQFMREAATEAQIDTNDITIALDTESASLFCQQTTEATAESGVDGEISKFPPGTRYVIIDAGGGKIEMTVFEVDPSGNLKEIHGAVGCNLGGNAVDEAFESTLEELFGKEVLKAFKDEEMIDWLQLWETFEQKKRDLQADDFGSVVIEIPGTLLVLVKRITGLDTELKVKMSRHAKDIETIGNELRISNRLMMTFFERPVKETVVNVKAILGKIENIDKIVMVGGLSASSVFQSAIKSEFPDAEVLNPEGEAVAAGSVIFQQKPQVLTQRILKKTYGVGTCVPFEYARHPIEKLMLTEDRLYCKDVFSKHVEKGQSIKVGEVQEESKYFPISYNQQALNVKLFASDENDPQYVDDCIRIGEILVDISDVPGDRTQDKAICVALIFSETEIKVTARVEKTGERITGTCNFLG